MKLFKRFGIIGLLVVGVVSWVLWSMQSSTPEEVLNGFLKEVQYKPYDFKKAILYVDTSNLEKDFIDALEEESQDESMPHYLEYKVNHKQINQKTDSVTYSVTFTYEDGFTYDNLYRIVKNGAVWQLDLTHQQTEYFQAMNESEELDEVSDEKLEEFLDRKN